MHVMSCCWSDYNLLFLLLLMDNTHRLLATAVLLPTSYALPSLEEFSALLLASLSPWEPTRKGGCLGVHKVEIDLLWVYKKQPNTISCSTAAAVH